MRAWCWWVFLLTTVAAGAQTMHAQREADHWQNQAEAAERDRAYDRAVACLSQVIALDPGRHAAYLQRAQNKERTAAWPEALVDYSIYLEWQPTHFEALWLRAMLLIRSKNWVAAQADLQRLLVLRPGETSHVVFEVDPFQHAVQRAFTTHTGSRPQLFHALGTVCLETGQYGAALTYFDSALALQPRYPEALANRGLAKEKLHRTEEARQDFREALQLNPDLEVAQHNLAVTHQQSPTEEEMHLTRLIDQNPAIPFPFYERATLRLAQERWDEALNDIQAALRIDSLNETYWVTRGIVYEKQRQWRKALRDYERAIQLNDQWPEAWFHHGNAARRLNQRTTAIEDYTMAIFLKSDYGNAYYNRAIMHYETGNYLHACADLQKAAALKVAINPKLKQKVCAK